MSTRLTAEEVLTRATAGTVRRNRLLINTLQVIAALADRPWRAVDLGQRLGIHKRALFRILNALEATGLRLERIGDYGSHYSLRKSAIVEQLGLEADTRVIAARREIDRLRAELATITHELTLTRRSLARVKYVRSKERSG